MSLHVTSRVSILVLQNSNHALQAVLPTQIWLESLHPTFVVALSGQHRIMNAELNISGQTAPVPHLTV